MITAINYNWYATPGVGEEFTNRAVGFVYGGLKCIKITEHSAAGDGDRWYYDVHYSDGSYTRIFNPNQVAFDNTEESSLHNLPF